MFMLANMLNLFERAIVILQVDMLEMVDCSSIYREELPTKEGSRTLYWQLACLGSKQLLLACLESKQLFAYFLRKQAICS